MQTEHSVVVGDSREMEQVGDGEVDLVVTSPPYPMIEMWDETFADLNPEVNQALDKDNVKQAFPLMHDELRKTWEKVYRVLTDGGIACINIGDATRKVDDSFRLFQNHAQVTKDFEQLGFEPLPDILWRKPVNSAAKFMGSGMLPPNAYATLEHEYILIFRKGKDSRYFEPGSDRRYSAAYFWEERNEWFSDIWMDIKGTLQALNNNELRERSAAYPLEIPYRLINMYSVYGDKVLDPFWGTGTTSLAAMIAGRNSIGYEIEEEFAAVFDDRTEEIERMSHEIISERVSRHKEFIKERNERGEELNYMASNYDFPVMTKQEKEIQFYTVSDVESSENSYKLTHSTFDNSSTEKIALGDSEQQSKLGANFK